MAFHQLSNSVGENEFNVSVYEGRGWDFHFHKSFEIIYVIKGEVSCTINSIKGVLSADDFGMCLPNEIHAYTPGEGAVYRVYVFSEDYVRSFTKQIRGKACESFKFGCSPSVKSFVFKNIENDEDDNPYMTKACLYALCGEYLKSVTLFDKDTSKREMMNIIADYIYENHKKDIKLRDVANLLGYDYNYVSRWFHLMFNMSFRDYINIYRLESALELMEKGSKKMVDISFESGFQSVRTFNQCFKKHFGVSPKEYGERYVHKKHKGV